MSERRTIERNIDFDAEWVPIDKIIERLKNIRDSGIDDGFNRAYVTARMYFECGEIRVSLYRPETDDEAAKRIASKEAAKRAEMERCLKRYNELKEGFEVSDDSTD
jgi:hypothetical protein